MLGVDDARAHVGLPDAIDNDADGDGLTDDGVGQFQPALPFVNVGAPGGLKTVRIRAGSRRPAEWIAANRQIQVHRLLDVFRRGYARAPAASFASPRCRAQTIDQCAAIAAQLPFKPQPPKMSSGDWTLSVRRQLAIEIALEMSA